MTKKTEPTEFDMELAEKWITFSLDQMSWLKPTIPAYANAIRKIRKSVGLSEIQMTELFEFIVEDDFWAPNAVSPAGLLSKSKNGLRKVDNVLQTLLKTRYGHLDVTKWAKDMDAQDAQYADVINISPFGG
jgi:hypothetical protein